MDKEVEDDGVLDALNADGGDVGGVQDGGKLGGLEEKVDKEPQSVRDSIRAAIKEESAPEDDKDEQRNRNLEKAREAKKLKRPIVKSDSEVDTNKDVLVKDNIVDDVDKDVSTPKSDAQPPNGWTKEAKAIWNKLPDSVKESVAKREKEASDGFKKYGEATNRLKELDAVIAPRREAIQRFGVSEAQTVDRLFQWMDALTGANKVNSWLALGQNFGINVNELVNKAGSQQSPAVNSQQQAAPQGNQIPDPIKQYVEGAMGSVSQYLNQQKQEAANGILSNWAKDKPHFQDVRKTMFALLNTGTIPLKDGNLDLDTAYDYACNANPEIRAELASASAEAAEKKAAANKEKAEAARIIKVNAARRAGASIKPTAPTGGDKSRKPAKGNSQAISVRDSIRESISELVNN